MNLIDSWNLNISLLQETIPKEFLYLFTKLSILISNFAPIEEVGKWSLMDQELSRIIQMYRTMINISLFLYLIDSIPLYYNIFGS